MRTRDENKELSIRQKAIEMVRQIGLEGFSMQKLAKSAGVSPATLYIYYKDKEDLLLQLSLSENKKLQEASLQNFHSEMSFEEGLRIQWKNRAAYFVENPSAVLFLEQIRYSQLCDKMMGLVAEDFKTVMSQFVHNARQNKQLVDLPFEVYWSVAFAPLYQLIKFHTQGRSFANSNFSLTDEAAEQALQLVLKALKP